MIFSFKSFLFCTLSFLSLVSCVRSEDSRTRAIPELERKSLQIQTLAGKLLHIDAELAMNDEQRSRGLMFRKDVPEGTGMLFIFEQDQVLSFWMKNTFVPLSIAFITSDGRILEIRDMEPESLAPIKSSRSVRYALEVPQSWFNRMNIEPGSKLVLDF